MLIAESMCALRSTIASVSEFDFKFFNWFLHMTVFFCCEIKFFLYVCTL
jgi:hypothetical protein